MSNNNMTNRSINLSSTTINIIIIFLVLSPGPGCPSNPLDFGLCLDAIMKSNVPLLGICLGHQGLCHAYGGIVRKNVKRAWKISINH